MHRFKQGQIQKKILDGQDVRGMFSVATEILKKNLKILNSINVFPVRDGDTGTNVLLTMRAAVAETDLVKDNSADHMADALVKGALLGAKGNSGVILSQFFRGLALSIKGKETIKNGEVVEYAKARSYAKGIGLLNDAATKNLPLKELVVTSNTNRANADKLAEGLKQHLAMDRLHFFNFGQTLGAHTGPNALSIAFIQGK